MSRWGEMACWSLEGQAHAEAVRESQLSALVLGEATVRFDQEKSLKELHGSVKSAQVLERKALLT